LLFWLSSSIKRYVTSSFPNNPLMGANKCLKVTDCGYRTKRSISVHALGPISLRKKDESVPRSFWNVYKWNCDCEWQRSTEGLWMCDEHLLSGMKSKVLWRRRRILAMTIQSVHSWIALEE
jgi:hypothetical protein